MSAFCAGTNTSCHTCQSLGVLDNVRASVSLHAPPVNAIKFSTEDLPKICQLLDLKVIQSQDTHDGSNSLYLLEQLMFLDSLASIEPPALKKRRMRNQHFWRDSAKLSVRERVYVQSAAVQLAIEEGLPVKPCAHLSKEQHTSVWTVCLTVFGVQELLNRRISPLGKADCNKALLCMPLFCQNAGRRLRCVSLVQWWMSVKAAASCNYMGQAGTSLVFLTPA